MTHEQILLFPVLIPLAAGILGVIILPKKNIHFAVLSLIAVLFSFASYIYLACSGILPLSFTASWIEKFSFNFRLDTFRSMLLCFVFVFQIMSMIYVLGYMRNIQRPVLFLLFMMIAFASSCGIVLASNYFLLIVFWEIFLLALYAVIQSSGDHAHHTAQKALIIGGSADFLMLFGMLCYFNFSSGASIDISSSKTAFVSFLFMFLGAGAKAGMFPFHTWIPDAAEVMPVPGFAAIPGSLEKIVGIYFLYVITHDMFILNDTARIVMYSFGIITIFAAIIPALVEQNLRKILAFAAISSVGYMVIGIATSEIAGIAGALMLMLSHAAYKSSLFFSAGILEKRGKSLAEIEGTGRHMPLTMLGVFLAFIASIGFPPSGSFMGKDLILHGLLQKGNYLTFILFCAGAILNTALFFKILHSLWIRKPVEACQKVPLLLDIPPFVLGACAVLTGIFFMLNPDIFSSALNSQDSQWLASIWHFSPVLAASAGILIFGFLLYFLYYKKNLSPSRTFTDLNKYPVLGTMLRLSSEKKLDGYEIGLTVLHWIAGFLFNYFDRMIDRVIYSIIRIGGFIFRPMLSVIHNGFFANYLGWVILGFIAALCLILNLP
jgi:formate hydrogenlyase subunit 3/multisubunit Na+/H+ antiporter MnhD subunit